VSERESEFTTIAAWILVIAAALVVSFRLYKIKEGVWIDMGTWAHYRTGGDIGWIVSPDRQTALLNRLYLASLNNFVMVFYFLLSLCKSSPFSVVCLGVHVYRFKQKQEN
jgi:hypothetical protein